MEPKTETAPTPQNAAVTDLEKAKQASTQSKLNTESQQDPSPTQTVVLKSEQRQADSNEQFETK